MISKPRQTRPSLLRCPRIRMYGKRSICFRRLYNTANALQVTLVILPNTSTIRAGASWLSSSSYLFGRHFTQVPQESERDLLLTEWEIRGNSRLSRPAERSSAPVQLLVWRGRPRLRRI